MEIKVGHYMGELGEAQSNALGGQLSQLVKNTEVLLAPVDPGEDPPGLEGTFATALDVALLDCEIDVAVASLHEIGLSAPEGVKLVAVTQRVDAREALIASSSMPIRTLPAGTRVHVDGPRRARQLKRMRADLDLEVTRMRAEELVEAVGSGQDTAAVVCLSDLRWMQKDSMASDMISTDEMLPAPGQGALGLLVREGDDAAEKTALMVHHRATYACTRAERACLGRLGWNAYSPAGALAHVDDHGFLSLRAAVFGPEGKRIVEASGTSSSDHAEELGRAVAEEVLKKGGEQILLEAREAG